MNDSLIKKLDTEEIQKGSWYLDDNEEGYTVLYRVDLLYKKKEYSHITEGTYIYIDEKGINMLPYKEVGIRKLKQMTPIPKDVAEAVVKLYKDTQNDIKEIWKRAVIDSLDLIRRPVW